MESTLRRLRIMQIEAWGKEVSRESMNIIFEEAVERGYAAKFGDRYAWKCEIEDQAKRIEEKAKFDRAIRLVSYGE
jgi:hypothetical protein